MSQRKLGKDAKGVLHSLENYGPYPGRWAWGSPYRTEQVLESLLRRGLVRTEEKKGRRFYYLADKQGGAS